LKIVNERPAVFLATRQESSSHEIEVYALTRSPDHSRVILFFYFFEAPHPTREEKEEDRWITCCCNTLHPLSTDQVRAGRRLHSSRPPNGKIFYFLSRFLFLLRCSNFYFSARKETRHCTKYHERKKRHSRARKAETKLSPHFDQS